MTEQSHSGESPSLKAYGASFLSERHRLMAFTQGLVRNPNVAEDIFQEVWVKLAETVANGVVIENQGAWCRAVARNLIFHYWRERHRETLVGDTELLTLVETAFDETEPDRADAELRRASLGDCLRLLPEKSRQLLQLKYFSGLSAKAIGATLKQSPESVLMALSRIRRVMAKCIENRLKGGVNP